MYVTKQQVLTYILNDFYAKKTNQENIGNESSHVFGVIKRSLQRMDLINENEEFKSKLDAPLQKDIVLAVAALHDVGDVIGRNNHNQFSKGIIQGKLYLQDILNEKAEPFNRLPADTRKTIKNYVSDSLFFKNEVDGDFYDFTKINEICPDIDAQNAIFEALKIKSQFDCFYNRDFNYSNILSFDNYFSTRFAIPKDSYLYKSIEKYAMSIKQTQQYMNAPVITDKAINANVNDLKEFEQNIRRYYHQCHTLSQMLHSAYSSEELEIIANAVQEHNIDYKFAKNRFEGSSIYSMIVADADKDNSIKTAILRRHLFTRNHADAYPYSQDIRKSVYEAETSPSKFPMLDCAFTVIGQFYQQYGAKSTPESLVDKIPKEIINVSVDAESLKVIKGIEIVDIADSTKEKSTLVMRGERTINGLTGILKTYKKQYDDFNSKNSCDTYSQLDTFFKTTAFSELNADYNEKACSLVDFSSTEAFIKTLETVINNANALEEYREGSFDEYITNLEAEMYKKLYAGVKGKENYANADMESFIENELPLNLQEMNRLTVIQTLSKQLGINETYFSIQGNALYLNDVPQAGIVFQDSIAIAEFNDDRLNSLSCDSKNLKLLSESLYSLNETAISNNIEHILDIQLLDNIIEAATSQNISFAKEIRRTQPTARMLKLAQHLYPDVTAEDTAIIHENLAGLVARRAFEIDLKMPGAPIITPHLLF